MNMLKKKDGYVTILQVYLLFLDGKDQWFQRQRTGTTYDALATTKRKKRFVECSGQW